MHQVKTLPLVCCKRTKDQVRGESPVPEEPFCLSGLGSETSKRRLHLAGELFTVGWSFDR